MRVEAGQRIVVEGETYQIIRKIGGGAIAEVYLISPAALDSARLVLKIPIQMEGGDQQRIGGLYLEAEVLRLLNAAEDPRWANCKTAAEKWERMQTTRATRRIITLFAVEDIDKNQPAVIQEMAPDAFRRSPIRSLEDELAILCVSRQVIASMVTAHNNKLAFLDFQPDGGKGDRVRYEQGPTP